MDNSYIKLCAEIAYNDVIIESVLNEEDNSILNEGVTIDKIKGFFEKIKNFLINIYKKISDFISNKIKELKTKIEEAKKKREEKKKEIKQESASLYNQLMEMVLTEGTDYDTALSTVYTTVIEKIINTEADISKYKEIAIEKLNQVCKATDKTTEEQAQEIFRKANNISKEFIDKSNLFINLENISNDIDRIVQKQYNPNLTSSLAPSEAFLKMCIKIADQNERDLKLQLKFLNDDRQYAENKYKELDAAYEDDNIPLQVSTVYFRELMHICSKQIENCSKIQNAYVKVIRSLNYYFGTVQRTATISGRL